METAIFDVVGECIFTTIYVFMRWIEKTKEETPLIVHRFEYICSKDRRQWRLRGTKGKE